MVFRLFLPSRMVFGLLIVSILPGVQTVRATTQVHVGAGPGGLSFVPDPVDIQVGDMVDWVWDASGHSVTSGTAPTPDGMFDTGLQNAGFKFSFTFNEAGTVPYFCTRHGAMMAGTVNVTAPSASPTPSPSPTVNISGSIVYCSNPSLNPVPGVTLSLTGTTGGTTISDGSGNYLFSSLPSGGNYTVTPSKAALPPGTAGISTVDVVAIQRHFLSLGVPLSGCRLTAADVNGLNGVNTVDVIATQRFFLSFSTGIANVGTYKFNPVTREYTGIVTNQFGQNYDGVIFGDVATSFVH